MDGRHRQAAIGGGYRSLSWSQAEGNEEGRCAHRVILVDGEIAGICSLHGINAAHRYARLGYWLADSHVGRG
ncbi:Uncharacterised protein [Chromobacterium violaceum]|uniref:N-acetyltransferase domain-containing protein n=1 Tax=Chromobacterium violaceum TaxID=536 RepID=A0A3S4IDZ9_CHRVL|nr:Uncharacterised protein [Chromobacterium violaceum]